MRQKAVSLLSVAALVFSLSAIYLLSAQSADQSNQLSFQARDLIIHYLRSVDPSLQLDLRTANLLFRKVAHFTLYALVGLLMLNLLRRLGISRRKAVIGTLIIGLLYAVSDEFHQSFTGRQPLFADILLDAFGVVAGVGLYGFIAWIIGKDNETSWKEQQKMKFQFAHNNFNVLDLEKSLKFYQEALGLVEVRRYQPESGEFILVYLGDGATRHTLELTWLKERTIPYSLGDNEFHLAFGVDDFSAAYDKHQKMGCICYENKAMGIYFINDPDGYWLEIVPAK